MGAVVDPFARGGDPLTRCDGCRIAYHGHDIAVASRLGSQHAEAILSVVIGDALDQAGQYFLG
jgi:hypothetical protein